MACKLTEARHQFLFKDACFRGQQPPVSSLCLLSYNIDKDTFSVVVWPAPSSAPATGRGIDCRTGILDGFIYRHNEASSLRCRCQSVDAHDGWLPHIGFKVIGDIFVVHIHAIPGASLMKRAEEASVMQ